MYIKNVAFYCNLHRINIIVVVIFISEFIVIINVVVVLNFVLWLIN